MAPSFPIISKQQQELDTMLRSKNSFSSSASSSFSSSSSSSSSLSLQIKENDKFFSKLLSREDSCLLDRVNKSSRASAKSLYYGVKQGSVPFTWESRPGTPKNPNTFLDIYSVIQDINPPLTPPPTSSYSSSPSPLSGATPKSTGGNHLRRKGHNLSLSGIVSRLKTTPCGSPRPRTHTFSLSDQSWADSSSSGLVSCSKPSAAPMTSSSSSPDSTLKFSTRRNQQPSGNNKFPACTPSPVAKAKKAFLSMVGHRRSSRGHAA